MFQHEGDDKCVQNFCWKNLKRIDHSEDADVVGKMILKLILKESG
jgi:hypothetical protein